MTTAKSNGNGNGTLAAALCAAQAEMPAVEPDAVNPHFQSKFVTLGKLIAEVRPVLNKHEIAVVQLPSQDEEGRPTLTTRLIHARGESMECTMPLLLSKRDPQGLGSALTYAKRYALAAMLAISDQEDDDGNAGSKEEAEAKAEPTVEEDHVQRLVAGISVLGLKSREIALIFGAVGAEAQEGNNAEAVLNALRALTPKQAEAFEAELTKRGEGGE